MLTADQCTQPAGLVRHSMRLRRLAGGPTHGVAWLVVVVVALDGGGGERHQACLPLPRIVTLYHAVAPKSCVRSVPTTPVSQSHCLARHPKPPARHEMMYLLSRNMEDRGHMHSR
jgi:hypothetical protein